MPSLITQVKSKLFLHSSRKSMHALDGAHASLLRGRSLDFEDLRKYEYGDQVRDIDWRATARLGTPWSSDRGRCACRRCCSSSTPGAR